MLSSKRSILIWLLCVALGAVIASLEFGLLDSDPRPTHDHSGGRFPVFDFGESDLAAVEVEYRGVRGALLRSDDGQWHRYYAAENHSEPSSAEIERGLDTSMRMLADRRLRPDRDLGEYGLALPSGVIAYYRRSISGERLPRPVAVLKVGDLLTTDFAYYARLDEEDSLILLPRYQVAYLLALVLGAEAAPSMQPLEDEDG